MLKNNLLTFCKRNTKYKQRFSPPEVNSSYYVLIYVLILPTVLNIYFLIILINY